MIILHIVLRFGAYVCKIISLTAREETAFSSTAADRRVPKELMMSSNIVLRSSPIPRARLYPVYTQTQNRK